MVPECFTLPVISAGRRSKFGGNLQFSEVHGVLGLLSLSLLDHRSSHRRLDSGRDEPRQVEGAEYTVRQDRPYASLVRWAPMSPASQPVTGQPGRVAPTSPVQWALSKRTCAPVCGASIISPAPT